MGQKKTFHAVHTPQHQASLRETEALMLTGFTSSVSRDCMVPDKTEPVAEPGTYDRNSAAGQSILANLREPAKVAKAGVFGTTKGSDRFRGSALSVTEEDNGPSPGSPQHRCLRRCLQEQSTPAPT